MEGKYELGAVDPEIDKEFLDQYNMSMTDWVRLSMEDPDTRIWIDRAVEMIEEEGIDLRTVLTALVRETVIQSLIQMEGDK